MSQTSKFYFQITHPVDEDGNRGRVIVVRAASKFDAWRRIGAWQHAHPEVEGMNIVAFYGHEPSEQEIDLNARNSDTFFSYDVI